MKPDLQAQIRQDLVDMMEKDMLGICKAYCFLGLQAHMDAELATMILDGLRRPGVMTALWVEKDFSDLFTTGHGQAVAILLSLGVMRVEERGRFLADLWQVVLVSRST